MKQTSLLPLTRLVLGVSALVQLVIGAASLFVPGIARDFLGPAGVTPDLAVQYIGVLYLGNSLSAAYAFYQDNWIATRTYLAGAALLVTLALIVTLIVALSPAGLRPIAWVYLVLSIIYLPLVGWVWRQEAARATP